MNQLNWLVFGAGAIGTYIGGSLALHGQRVVFLEQSSVVDELRQRGMRLDLVDGEHHLPNPEVVGSVKEALTFGPYDIAVFALKSYDTNSALQSLIPHKDELPAFLCLQNGVENETLLAEKLGKQRIIPGTVTSAIGRLAVGNIVVEKERGIGIADSHDLSLLVATNLNASGLNAHLIADAQSMKWSKMLTNLLANAIPAILDLTPAEVLSHPGLFDLEIKQLRETLMVMRVLDLQAINLPKTPVRLLALAVRGLPTRLSQPLIQRVAGRGRGAKMPSLHIDLHSKRGKSEVDFLNGAVARIGLQQGLATPVNQKLWEIFSALIMGKTPLDTYKQSPKKLLDQF